MKLGTSLRFVFPTGDHTLAIYQHLVATLPPGAFVERPMGPPSLAAQVSQLVDLADAARRAGLWALIVGENHNVPAMYANCFQPVPTIARLSAHTGGLTIGAVFLAPFHHPLMLAEQIATVAAFVDAPTLWVFVVGDRPAAFDAVAIPLSERTARTDALVPAVRALLAGESVTAVGPGWALTDATVSPLPRHPVQLLIGGAVDAAVDRAARIGDGWLTAQNATDDELMRKLDRYADACARRGRRPLPVLRRDVHVAATDETALAHVAPILAEGYRGLDFDRLVVGSPATVLERLDAYRSMGFDRVLVRHITGDRPELLESFALLGAEVLPEITRWQEPSW